MVNLKNYVVSDDFSHHKEEFYQTYEIIKAHTTFKDKMILNLCSRSGVAYRISCQKRRSGNRGRSPGL